MSWEMVKIEDLCTIVRGSSPRPQGDPRYYNGKVPRLMIEDLTRDGKYVTPQVDSLTEEGAKLSRPMKKGDLVMTVSGRTGVPAILNVDCCIHDGFVGFRELSKIVDIDYLFYYLASLTATTSQQAVGAIFKNLTTDQLKNIDIPLPPITTQKRIAEILDTADALKRKDQALLKKYDELAQAIFIDMFGDPVKNEKGWEVKSLKIVTTKIGSGATPTGGKTAYKSEGISLIRSMNVYDFAFKWKDLAFIDETQAAKLNNVTVESNDVLFNITGASVCRCSIVPDELLPARVNQHVSIIRAKTEVLNPIFLNHLLVSNSVKTKLLGLGSGGGAVMEAITKEQLEQFEIIVPPIELQNDFENINNNVFKQKEIDIIGISQSEKLFQTLIQKAFKGEVVTE
ncbi:MAG: restriction endonuclease subunit S [Saprospiraceae bacterium]|nr:restriction endonuclease subunit S [Saprospiraceae bacterium]